MSFACDHSPGRNVLDFKYSANAKEASLVLSSLTGYIAGMTDVNITVEAGVYLWSDSTATPGLTISGGAAGDRVRLINRGNIIGKGGKGGSILARSSGIPDVPTLPTAGGPALRVVGVSLEIDNSAGYICGGGGGGGASAPGGRNSATQYGMGYVGGGGGAGGGAGGDAEGYDSFGVLNVTGGAGGAIGSAGSAGVLPARHIAASGAGGGRVLPGATTTGTSAANTPSSSDLPPPGGSAGGPGGSSYGANFSASNTFWVTAAGGGGGWGAVGGSGRYTSPTNTNVAVLTDQQPVGGSGGGAGNAGGNGAIPAGAQSVLTFQAGAAGGKAIELQSGATRSIVLGADRIYGATS